MVKNVKIIDRFMKGVDLFASAMMAFLTIIVFAEVLSRYVFNYPLVYSNELTLLLFPWVIFIGAISITKSEGHLSITFFRELMPKKVQKWMYLFSKAVMLYFSFYMMISSYEIAKAVSQQVMPVLRISKAWLYASITVSFLAIMILLVYQIICILLNKLVPPREEDMLHDLDHDH
ncbi:TRAP transporter small permease [Metabacillus sp. HB246100]